MINLKNYIIESLFDVNDNTYNMEYEIFQLFISSSTFLDSYKGIINMFKK